MSFIFSPTWSFLTEQVFSPAQFQSFFCHSVHLSVQSVSCSFPNMGRFLTCLVFFWTFFVCWPEQHFITVLLVALGTSYTKHAPGSGTNNRVGQLKPKPVPLGLCVARMGSVIPLPSGPRPIPGLQPMLCIMRLPIFESGMGGAPSPTTPRERGHRLEEKKILTVCV